MWAADVPFFCKLAKISNMSDPEIHLLDDIAKELLEDKLRRKRLRIGIGGSVVQIGLGVLFVTKHFRLFGLFLGWLPLLVMLLTLFVQSRYRSGKPSPAAEG